MIVIDTETTGLLVPDDANLFAQPHVTQIYGLKVDEDYNKIKEFNHLVKPPIPIPPDISRFTNIYDATVANAPTFVELVDELIDFFIGEEVVLGQNINFDMGVLQYELRRIDMEYHFPYPRRRLDTVEMSYPIFNKRLRLGVLHEHCFGEGFDNAHDAKADVQATLRCFKWLVEHGYLK